MTLRFVRFLVAVCVTTMDVFVAARYGGLLWVTWSPIAWARVGLLLLAGGIVFTLTDIWSKTTGYRAVLLSSQSPVGDFGGADV